MINCGVQHRSSKVPKCLPFIGKILFRLKQTCKRVLQDIVYLGVIQEDLAHDAPKNSFVLFPDAFQQGSTTSRRNGQKRGNNGLGNQTKTTQCRLAGHFCQDKSLEAFPVKGFFVAF